MSFYRRCSLVIASVAAVLLSISAARAADIFPDNPHATADVRTAIAKARREHKRVLLNFGGNWCPDCHLLDLYLHQPPNEQLLDANFVMVPINIGKYDMNTDLAEKYEVPLKRGVPELVVLTPDGRVLNGMTTAVFEKMSRMEPSTVTDFLNQWKPKHQHP